jgi:hypothetical protein
MLCFAEIEELISKAPEKEESSPAPGRGKNQISGHK